MEFPDVIIILICEYLGKECKNYLINIGKGTKYKYLYTEYDDTYTEYFNVRYLKNVNDTSILVKYPNLLELKFSETFNQSVDNLPKSITHLTFGFNFNQSVDNLPKSITYLKFGWYFNQPINNLPQSITHLTFG